MTEQCEGMREQTSEWPSTYVSLLFCSEPYCSSRGSGRAKGDFDVSDNDLSDDNGIMRDYEGTGPSLGSCIVGNKWNRKEERI